MGRKNINHLKAHLLMYEAEYPIQKGYIARLMIVEDHSVNTTFREARKIVQIEEPGKDLYKRSFFGKAYRLKNRVLKKSQRLTREWQSLMRLFLQPFSITLVSLAEGVVSPQPEHKPFLHHSLSMGLMKASICGANSATQIGVNVSVLPGMIKLEPDYDEHSEVDPWKAAYDKDGEDYALGAISLASDLSSIDAYVSSHSPVHNRFRSTDVEENRTEAYNSQSSVSVRDNVLLGRTLNHQGIDSENIAGDICYVEDVRSGEDENKQTHKEVTDRYEDYSDDFHQRRNNKLLEQELPTCEKVPHRQRNGVNIVLCSREYLDEILANKWKTKCVASQKSYQSSILQSFQSSVVQSPQISVLHPLQSQVLQSHQSSVVQSPQISVLHPLQPKVLQSFQPSVLHPLQSQVLQSFQSSVVQSPQISVLHPLQPKVLQSFQPSVLHPLQSQVLQSHQSSGLQTDQSLGLQSVELQDLKTDQPPASLQSAQVPVLQSNKCKFCDCGFLQNSSQILEAHTEGTTFECSICGRLDSVLTRHTEGKPCEGTQLGDKLYKCHICGHGFKRYFLLKNHKLKHTRNRHYKCDVCGREYTNISVLKIHSKIHSSVKPYKCDICGRGFAVISYLKQHAKIHAREKPYNCDVCGRAFAFNSFLKIHTRSHT